MGIIEDGSLIFCVGAAIVVPLVPIPWSNEPFFGNFYAIFHVRLYLNYNKRYWSKIWRQVHSLVELENGRARKLREGTVGGSKWPIPWSMLRIWPYFHVRPKVDPGC
jgi:hypothetical protein